nr:hypothetical protein [Tanacetum cinerariifolium]
NQSNPGAGVQEQFDTKKKGGNVQQYVLFLLWSSSSKNPQNTDDDAAFGGKKPEFEGEKPESEVHVSPSCNAQTKKHDDKTKREAKGKSPIQFSTGYRNLSAVFEDFSDNSINEVNAADSPVLSVGQISTNNTNTFSDASPSNTDVSPTHGKSSYMDPSQYPDDLNMLALEDITYSDNEEDVGAEADFTNLETNITVNPIPTTRVYKDHPEELLQYKMQKVWVLVDLPNGKWVIGHTQEEGIDYEEVFAPVARIEAIRSQMGYLLARINIDKILRKFGLTDGKSASTPIDTEKPLLKDPDGEDVDVHT